MWAIIVCVPGHVRACVHVYVFVCACVCAFVHVCAHLCLCVHVYVRLCVHVCVVCIICLGIELVAHRVVMSSALIDTTKCTPCFYIAQALLPHTFRKEVLPHLLSRGLPALDIFYSFSFWKYFFFLNYMLPCVSVGRNMHMNSGAHSSREKSSDALGLELPEISAGNWTQSLCKSRLSTAESSLPPLRHLQALGFA